MEAWLMRLQTESGNSPDITGAHPPPVLVGSGTVPEAASEPYPFGVLGSVATVAVRDLLVPARRLVALSRPGWG